MYAHHLQLAMQISRLWWLAHFSLISDSLTLPLMEVYRLAVQWQSPWNTTKCAVFHGKFCQVFWIWWSPAVWFPFLLHGRYLLWMFTYILKQQVQRPSPVLRTVLYRVVLCGPRVIPASFTQDGCSCSRFWLADLTDAILWLAGQVVSYQWRLYICSWCVVCSGGCWALFSLLRTCALKGKKPSSAPFS